MPRGVAPEVVRQFIDAFNKGDLDAFVETLDPEVELHSAKGTRSGVKEARAWAARAPGGVQQHVIVEDLVEGDDAVVALIVRQWHWADEGGLASSESMAWLFRLRDGRIASWRPFENRDEALRAAGIG